MHDVYATQDCSPSICLPKATTLLQETGAMCENQLIPSHWFTEHLKQSCTWNSERLLLMPVDEKDKLRKTASSREDAVSVDACVENWVAPLSGHNRIWQS